MTEGSNDKDADLCHIDSDGDRAFVCQSYLSDDWNKQEAPSNKADDLLTALSWLRKGDLEEIPARLRTKARDLQAALSAGEISTVYLLYIHNCRESSNVQSALATVAQAAKVLLGGNVSVTARELGLPSIQRSYDSLTKQIAVDERIRFVITRNFQLSGKRWKAVATTISGEILHNLWVKHGDDLFSANIRGFLDMLNRKSSINRGILDTIEQHPDRFWAYNNGVTILTKKIAIRGKYLTATGISVINGAQTTGVLGNASAPHVQNVQVPCRFIQCNDSEIIEDIIAYNNTQNSVKSFDYRSNDPIQNSLRDQFKSYGISYLHRRSGATKTTIDLIQAETFSPYLAAFHGNFQVATRQRRSIFEDRNIYLSVYKSDVTAEHVYLVQSLADALSMMKQEYKAKMTTETANEVEKKLYDLLKHSTSKQFVVAMVGKLGQQVLNKPISNLFSWKTAKTNVKPDRKAMVARWRPVLDCIIPLVAKEAQPDTYETVRSSTRLDEIAKRLAFDLESLRTHYDSSMSAIRDASEAT